MMRNDYNCRFCDLKDLFRLKQDKAQQVHFVDPVSLTIINILHYVNSDLVGDLGE